MTDGDSCHDEISRGFFVAVIQGSMSKSSFAKWLEANRALPHKECTDAPVVLPTTVPGSEL